MDTLLFNSSKPILNVNGSTWQYKPKGKYGLINFSEMCRLYDQIPEFWLNLGETLYTIKAFAAHLNMTPEIDLPDDINDLSDLIRNYPQLIGVMLNPEAGTEDFFVHPFQASQLAALFSPEFSFEYQTKQMEYCISTGVFCNTRYTGQIRPLTDVA